RAPSRSIRPASTRPVAVTTPAATSSRPSAGVSKDSLGRNIRQAVHPCGAVNAPQGFFCALNCRSVWCISGWLPCRAGFRCPARRECSGSFFQKRLESDSVVVIEVVGAEEEGDIVFPRSLQERTPGFAILFQLPFVAAAEFSPSCRVMSEPAPQLITWRNILQPAIQPERLFFHPAGPETVNQEAETVVLSGRVIDPFDTYHFSDLNGPRPAAVRFAAFSGGAGAA